MAREFFLLIKDDEERPSDLIEKALQDIIEKINSKKKALGTFEIDPLIM